MSIQFNDTTTLKGLVQLFEEELEFESGYISNDPENMKRFTADVNLTIDDYTQLAIQSSGKWQFDDSNHSKYPEIYTNLIAGQRDYPFTVDEQGNLVLDIYRVYVKNEDGIFFEIPSSDRESGGYENQGFNDGQNIQGVPSRYNKTANGIFLDQIPSYNSTNGLKVQINREGSYFVSTDTTKKPGVPGIHHEYFFLKPAYRWARRKKLSKLAELEKAVIEYEGSERLRVTGKIQDYFNRRSKDERDIMSGKKINFI